ncbi:3199_t:CDS:2, partial [Rhizophagus irregularis]
VNEIHIPFSVFLGSNDVSPLIYLSIRSRAVPTFLKISGSAIFSCSSSSEDSGETRKPDFSIALQKIYYQPIGYQRNAKKLFEASLKAGYDFTLDEVKDWLERQAVYRIHKSHPKYIPRASFCSITTPNKVHQADVLYMPYDKVGRVTYLFCLNVVDVASRYKASVPIGAYSGLVKEFGYSFEYINNSNTDQLGISPVDAIEKEEVFAKPSYPRDGPIGFDEEKLSDDVLVRYLLYPSDLEGGRHRAGDLNWSPHIYHICQSMVQKNQPVLYWLEEVPFELIDNDDYILKRPERSFVREELMVIPFDTELPPQWVLTN